MGKSAERKAGAIYRFFEGRVTKLFDRITITNAISFAPDGRTAYFTDTPGRQILRQPLDAQGWPEGGPSIFIDLRAESLNPDGAVVDEDGCLWNAQWGANRVAHYSPEGEYLNAFSFPAAQVSCPAFGGEGLTRLFATSAAHDLHPPGAADGQTFVVETGSRGQAEHQVLL